MAVEVQDDKPRWPYRHRYTSVAQRSNDGKTMTVKVYTRRTPGLSFFMVVTLMALVFMILMAVAAISALSQVSQPIHP